MYNSDIKSSMRCLQCGYPVLPEHSFCPSCGHPLTKATTQQIPSSLMTIIDECTPLFQNPCASKRYILDLCESIRLRLCTENEYDSEVFLNIIEPLSRSGISRKDLALISDLSDRLYDYLIEISKQEL